MLTFNSCPYSYPALTSSPFFVNRPATPKTRSDALRASHTPPPLHPFAKVLNAKKICNTSSRKVANVRSGRPKHQIVQRRR
ncbi:hypothetical protein BU23DRAFT_266648 [Bimuria novae-zelandiae CBS 107.79]|uniref:Uncharacterized protein n=1 Tax=Bimuria novae-zelandiae CBS 107.79 TaxID=1447943 RepID=A0A6A5UZV0_9PLEO|nr:hypothetical protein BU23DRAFT_266648 [Bimuria novae-zelandiae CBS 107.79]